MVSLTLQLIAYAALSNREGCKRQTSPRIKGRDHPILCVNLQCGVVYNRSTTPEDLLYPLFPLWLSPYTEKSVHFYSKSAQLP